jgi:hypothetical protein
VTDVVAQAVMELTKHDKVHHYTFCPVHNKKTSDVVGMQKDTDDKLHVVFRCKEKGVHLFLADPDPSAPKKPEDVDKWVKKQQLARLAEDDPRHKGQ